MEEERIRSHYPDDDDVLMFFDTGILFAIKSKSNFILNRNQYIFYLCIPLVVIAKKSWQRNLYVALTIKLFFCRSTSTTQNTVSKRYDLGSTN